MRKVTPSATELQAVADNYTVADAITPSDTTVVAFDAVYVGATGNVVVDMLNGGSTITFTAVPAGTLLKIGVVKVHAASTATGLIGLNY